MNNLRHALIVAALICLALSTAFANKKEDEADEFIRRAQDLSDFRKDGSPPFRLKATLKITNDDGSTVEGTYTEFWTSSAQWRQELILGDLHRTEVAVGKKVWTLGTVNPVSDHVGGLGTLFDLSLRKLWKASVFENKQIGGTRARCFHSAEQHEAGEFCFDKATGALLVNSLGRQTCVFENYRSFGERSVPESYECIHDKKIKIEARLVELVLRPELAEDLFTPPSGSTESTRCFSPVRPPKLIHAEEPRLLKGDGVVTIGVVIAKDGRPRDLKILNSLDASSDAEAIDAVQRWRFEPATCDGEPVNVSIAIEVDMHHR